MKLRPILFSTPMVQAILEGRKTQTRRVVKPQPITVNTTEEGLSVEQFKAKAKELQDLGLVDIIHGTGGHVFPKCPYGKVGDVLWVRETFGHNGLGYYRYKALYTEDGTGYKHGFEKWKPSIHMPFEAARIFLEITNVRVQRLQSIGKQDALREGIQGRVELEDTRHEKDYYQYNFGGERYQSAVDAFSALWQSINGEQSWTANPWVWVVEFKRINKPTP